MRLISAGIQIPRQGSKEGRQSSKSNKSNATLPTHFTFREESDTLSKIIPIILLKTCESNILLPIFNIQSCCPVVQNRNPKTNPNLPSKLYIFHACSTSALENTKQRKEDKQKYIFSFFLSFLLLPFLSYFPEWRTITWYSERCLTSASWRRVSPLLATDKLGNAGKFS